ncbi:hypothetical protein A1O3_06453 [Capronia epimyces CBS 606.96]|uniref:Uncharacterized protein n=1 Tax=Capronia epimyces CBS 606.96 TaxID=1182542 RepID=W9XZ34_9EURO|nr:uncharacterized protein A1O3_06453 [Capronia epimyces CBS 606.96]EXJ82640.1 hypothetical protein A1O3_06453 [Capronia epimyces CBS 606.96]
MTFQPAFEQRALEKLKEEFGATVKHLLRIRADCVAFYHRELAAADLGPNLIEIPAQTIQPPKAKADEQAKAPQTG